MKFWNFGLTKQDYDKEVYLDLIEMNRQKIGQKKQSHYRPSIDLKNVYKNTG